MANSNTQIVLIGAIGLVAVYMLTRRQTSTPLPYYPTQQPNTQQQQTQQLLNWAQTQSAGTTITNIIKGLDWQGIADMWGKIFGGGSSSQDYSGGGSDVPDNPYQEYDPWNYGSDEIWA